MSGPEKTLERRVVARLAWWREGGVPIWWFKVISTGRQVRGLPDLCVVLYGRSVWIELKTEANVATPLQRARMEEIRRGGAICFVAKSVDEVDHRLRAFFPQLPVPG